MQRRNQRVEYEFKRNRSIDFNTFKESLSYFFEMKSIVVKKKKKKENRILQSEWKMSTLI